MIEIVTMSLFTVLWAWSLCFSDYLRRGKIARESLFDDTGNQCVAFSNLLIQKAFIFQVIFEALIKNWEKVLMPSLLNMCKNRLFMWRVVAIREHEQLDVQLNFYFKNTKIVTIEIQSSTFIGLFNWRSFPEPTFNTTERKSDWKIWKMYHIRVAEKLEHFQRRHPCLSLHVWLINSSWENADVTQRCGRFLIVGLGRGTVHWVCVHSPARITYCLHPFSFVPMQAEAGTVGTRCCKPLNLFNISLKIKKIKGLHKNVPTT